jgi:hypothetical protein
MAPHPLGQCGLLVLAGAAAELAAGDQGQENRQHDHADDAQPD